MTRSQATPESSQIITLTRMLEEREETMYAQAAVIEALRAHLKVIAGLQLCADNLMSNSDIAAKALAIPTDSTQILDEVRRAERERCAQISMLIAINGIETSAAIREME